MKDQLYYRLIDIRHLTTGRRIFALMKLRDLAEAGGFADIVAAAEEAIAHDEKTLESERSWRNARSASTARGEAAALDSKIDSLLGAFHSALVAQSSALEGTEEGDAAGELVVGLFPGGVVPIIHRSFEDQLGELKAMLGQLDGPLKDAAKKAGAMGFGAKLSELVTAFAAELEKKPAQGITFDQVQAARVLGNLHVRRIVALVLGTVTGMSEADEQKRAELLGPILEQDRRTGAAFRSRRGLVDIDPSTGEEDPTSFEEPVVAAEG